MDTETLSPRDLLVAALQDEYEQLKGFEAGTDGHRAIVDEIVKLQDRLNELDKNEAERVEREASRKNDMVNQEAQRKDEKKYRIIGHCITVAFGLLELASFRIARHETFNFEKDATVTTGIGRSILNSFVPKRRNR